MSGLFGLSERIAVIFALTMLVSCVAGLLMLAGVI